METGHPSTRVVETGLYSSPHLVDRGLTVPLKKPNCILGILGFGSSGLAASLVNLLVKILDWPLKLGRNKTSSLHNSHQYQPQWNVMHLTFQLV